MNLERFAISTGEKPSADRCRLTVRDLALSVAEEVLEGGVVGPPLANRTHARQRCVDHVEVDADDYPGGDPQNGQRGSC